MELKNKITELISSFFKTEKSDLKLSIDDRINNIDLLKSEVNELVKQFDENETYFNPLVEKANQSLEKGNPDSKTILEHISNKYSARKNDILKSLDAKKFDLIKEQEQLDLLVKGESNKKKYADSIVRDCHGNILLLLRGNVNSFEPNKWGLPGGKVDEGEDFETASIRELKEETNLDSCGSVKIAEKEVPNGTINYFSSYITGDQLSFISLDSDEHVNYTFMSLDELKSRPASDFIIGLKDTLLELLDVNKYVSVQKLEKAHEEGELDSDTYNDVIAHYTRFNFEKKND